MSYRRRRNDLTLPIAKLALLVTLGFMFIPQLRVVAVVGSVVSVGLVLGLVLYRMNDRPSQIGHTHQAQLDRSPCPLVVSEPQLVVNSSSTTELISRLRSIDWFQFEKIVATTYQHLGYSVCRRGGAKPDGGIDLVLERNGERMAVQCKHWRTWNVGVRAVRELLGALVDSGLKQGVLVTLCGYTGDATRLADKHGIEIVNESGLARLLEATNAAGNREVLALLNDTRKFCPKCEAEMLLRTAKKGTQVGTRFWGCSAYPRCRYTMPVLAQAA